MLCFTENKLIGKDVDLFREKYFPTYDLKRENDFLTENKRQSVYTILIFSEQNKLIAAKTQSSVS